MERKTASDFPPGVLKLFDQYVHGWMSRREFLDGAAKFAVGSMSAAAMLEALKPNYAFAQQVPREDSRIRAEYMLYPSTEGSGTMRGYYARPANVKGKIPGVLVMHENRGLNPYVEDVTRRLALANFAAFAPDALTPLGGYPGNEEMAAQMFRKLDAGKTVEDFMAAIDFLKVRPECSGRYGAVGFCVGGSTVNLIAVRRSDLGAGVPFYGSAPNTADAAKIKAPMLIHYAGLDQRVNAGWPAFEAGLKQGKVRYAMHMYPNTNHGFHNDSTPRYDAAAAKLAWERTVAFFDQHLRK